MTTDRYTKAALGIIAACLVYLCVADMLRGTPAAAQVYATPTPGEQTGPLEVIIVEWRNLPADGLPVHTVGPVDVVGRVALDASERISVSALLSGWEADGRVRTFANEGLPVQGTPNGVALRVVPKDR